METSQREPEFVAHGLHLPRGKGLPGWLGLGLRWLGIMGVALGLATLWLVLIMRPTTSDLAQMIWWLIVSGTSSIIIGAAAFWLVDAAHLGSVRLKFAIPSLLAGLVIALNTLLAAHMMFISDADAQMLIAFLIFGECVALALSSSLVASITQTIRRVAQGARHLATGEYSVRLAEKDLSGITEFEQLAHGFNQMAASVQEAFANRDAAEANRRQVVAAISHDVRTPLTIMRAMVEAIDDGIVTDPEIIHRYHSAIRAEMRHLSTLIDDLFEVSRIEAGALQLNRDRLNIEDIISDILEVSHEQAERHHIRISGEVTPNLPAIWADARQLYRVVTNLVQNALRHTPAGGAILLQVWREKSSLMVQVIDTGEGIESNDLPHIFELAYRGETSRKRPSDALDDGHEQGGTGLGLAIARGLVEAHGGIIQAISPLPSDLRAQTTPSDLPGTVVRFTLPIGQETMPSVAPPPRGGTSASARKLFFGQTYSP